MKRDQGASSGLPASTLSIINLVAAGGTSDNSVATVPVARANNHGRRDSRRAFARMRRTIAKTSAAANALAAAQAAPRRAGRARSRCGDRHATAGGTWQNGIGWARESWLPIILRQHRPRGTPSLLPKRFAQLHHAVKVDPLGAVFQQPFDVFQRGLRLAEAVTHDGSQPVILGVLGIERQDGVQVAVGGRRCRCPRCPAGW